MQEQTPKPRRGILFYGCVAGLVLLFMVIAGGLLGLHYAKKMLIDFTDAAPATLPQVQLPQDKLDALQQRVELFRDAVRAGKPPAEPLSLTPDEINALIATDPDLRSLKGKVYVSLVGDQIKGQVSVPMEQVGLPLFKSRYLNGQGTFSLSMHRSRLRLTVMSFVVKNRKVPEVYMEQIRKYNFADPLNEDPRGRAALDHLQEIKVQDGKLLVIPQQKPGA